MLVITKENFQMVREMGMGNGFTVVNPADGFRKDNRLWFGTCSECGESVTNSALSDNGWEHTLILSQTLHANGTVASQSSKQIDYCPKA